MTPVTVYNEQQFHILQVIPFSNYLLYQAMTGLHLNYRLTLEQLQLATERHSKLETLIS